MSRGVGESRRTWHDRLVEENPASSQRDVSGRDGAVGEERGPSTLGVDGRASALKGRTGDPIKLASRG